MTDNYGAVKSYSVNLSTWGVSENSSSSIPGFL